MHRADGRTEGNDRAADRAVRVLLVDDHADTLALYSESLTLRGATIRTAENSRAAIAVARDFRPDVVVTDLLMPGGGIRVLAALRRFRRPTVLRVVLTASHDDRLHARAVRAGCEVLIVKPCAPDDLFAVLQRELDQRGRGTLPKENS